MKALIFIGLVVGIGAGPDDLLTQSIGVLILVIGVMLCHKQMSEV